jgi:hypothetical protein
MKYMGELDCPVQASTSSLVRNFAVAARKNQNISAAKQLPQSQQQHHQQEQEQ